MAFCDRDQPPCTNYSEDYYGELDLKSIRKSELLAGLQNNGEARANPKAKSARPAAAAPSKDASN